MREQFIDFLQKEIETLKSEGLYKSERVISSQQQAAVTVNHKEVINLCANNYLGLANDPELISEGQKALAQYGYGMASVRFICGTQTPHKQLEQKVSQFLNQEDTILYSSCFDANTGLFETLLGEDDAIISDALNHASIIDGVRLCKAARYRYANNDMKALEEQLIAAQNARFRLIATDGVFSMDGILANLPAICELADKYNAMVMVDDSHAVGFMGKTGRGTPEHFGVSDRVDIITGTLGKALGGASGGYTAANKTIVEWLRQRSRPYLFSNTLAPVIAHTSCIVLDNLMKNNHWAEKLKRNSKYFREGMTRLGFKLIPGEHPIIPVMLGDASLAGRMANRLLELGIYVVGFSYPVVPKGLARIRTQMSAAHELHHLDKAIAAFETVGKEFSVI
ncbi:glycine C-acetyltransferase [Legionella longbeachae]|uniref:2-amino-3-ketobutyrate coenzyme A ligase n=1 Tax=Legionella longbeachae serogroup 1 (strain NSW150) TaxID=661367 RepID=D3HQI2_LEGLN|nr:glycine C-acetyltransferase [Legionella longbeachae]VEE01670.1 2-amino-3-ketobutyrate CoA ligase [Legionella oakridgensis]HBD7396428.1 glycine C-acetyltransferase [Legionella pneumophila]ARM34822.1 glycine C-acetyltransferase [Legionella longbeachae]AVH82768.1 glycine C-acetyltransferase [Legionella longbeachae]EEZ95735.1 2-amino-3-ketobutyrate coenzyme A ligase [Legionella longbeachae D-4968]